MGQRAGVTLLIDPEVRGKNLLVSLNEREMHNGHLQRETVRSGKNEIRL